MMWIGDDLDSMVVAITNQQMASVRFKTQACWMIEITEFFLTIFAIFAIFAKGVEVGQGGSMEPLQTMVTLIRDNHLFMLWIIDDGVMTIELTTCISFLACGAGAAQERLLIHLTIP